MINSQLKQKILLLAGTLLIGALGSGLWEVAIKPSLLWVVTLVLDIATLGLSSLRDGLYVEIARGTYERASLMVMSAVFGGFAGVFLAIATRGISKNRQDTAQNTSRTRRRFVAAAALSMFVALLVQSFRISYIIRATNYLNQLERVVAPYIPDEQLKQIDSRIARMQTREEYVAISDQLVGIIRSKNVDAPTFNIY